MTLALLGEDALITRSRSTILSHFLDHETATHLLFIDADIGFEPEQVQRLLSFDRDFVAAFYPIKAVDWELVAHRMKSNDELFQQAALSYVGTLCTGPEAREEAGFATATYAGGGFQLIKRGAVEKMIAAYPEQKFRSIHVFPRAHQTSENNYALFDCMIDSETGEYLSEDYAFCRRWRDIGGEVWLDLSSRLTHVGTHHFRGDTTVRFRNTPRQSA
ncbi:MAG TPA: hypothetical protein VNT30_22515 [Stellaceae bacterium]|nr:hypothetical protein [Stellaceae bacterium]